MELSILDPALPKREPSAKYLKERDICMGHFQYWNEQDQIDFVEELLLSMHHHQHGTVNAFLKPMLQRDFISLLPKKGLDHVAENVLSFLDARSLCAAELVSKEWLRVISEVSLHNFFIVFQWRCIDIKHDFQSYVPLQRNILQLCKLMICRACSGRN